ncbi:phosphoethanolamine--lipid A transferase [Shewanella sp. 202IG2-18]|uniref:phosphoethanolamine transferase n=1 Tax=Parashewanella hymeniacidonis TaxID=2807618 RepID=UPI00196115F7|nr:phosphoethanolamine--lipid A transferase [Parashewanella hymeniacidonis]MBM7070636.1 phosphoethanolamine--lipid A transferase [Parashewanella hymeniacidonis]
MKLLTMGKSLSYSSLAFITALYYTTIVNIPVYAELRTIFDHSQAVKIGFIISIPILFLAVFNLVFNLFSWPYLTKPIFVLLLISSSMVSYASFNYGTLFDRSMMENIFETNSGEALSYLSWSSIGWIFLMGVIPALILIKTPINKKQTFIKLLLSKSISIIISVLTVVLIASLYYQDYASVGRNHKLLNRLIIPTQYVYSTIEYLTKTYLLPPLTYKQLGTDAVQAPTALITASKKPTLLVFLVGETARAQNYHLDGYKRNTNPYTEKQNVIAFQHVTSCGTATAISVPCMFSALPKADYNARRAAQQDNLIDILNRAKVSTFWLDNDEGDKDVAKHTREKELDTSQGNQECDCRSCHDIELLDGFKKYVQTLTGNRVFFMHMMGSHGPTYFQRYPKNRAKFQPDCQRSDIENCSIEQITNSYDNTILYTDFFMSQVINQLKSMQNQFNTALFYISDHGESLGEDGLFLHGTPYSLAPDYQTHVPLIFWASKGFEQTKHLNRECLLQQAKTQHLSQDYVFHSVLGIMDIKTRAYNTKLDIFAACRK